MSRSLLKNIKSKINFEIGRNPHIERRPENYRRFIPTPYKAVVTITADFELVWAWRYAKGFDDSYKAAIEKAQQARNNIPKILELCEQYNVPITWATVGHLFLKECKRENGKAHPNIKRIPYFENRYLKYTTGDWFEHDPCTNWQQDPEWYAPDLIKMILNSKVNHEIGCHTFSHIDTSDELCPSEVFLSELEACKNAASQFGLELKSFVHPGHTIGHLKELKESGFTSFQTDFGNFLGFPVKHPNGLWELKRTYEFIYRSGWSIDYHIYRYKKIIDRAIKSNTVCNFWFHPPLDEIFVKKIMPEIFKYISSLQNKIYLPSVGNYINWINNRI